MDHVVAQPSVQSFLLETWTQAGKPVMSATGFSVSFSGETYLITNRHVVTGLKQGTNELIGNTVPDYMTAWIHADKGWLRVPIQLVNDAFRPLWFEHPSLGKTADVVALRIPPDDRLRVVPYQLPEPPD